MAGKVNRNQIVKGIIVLVVVWAIIAAGVYLYNKNDVVAVQSTDINPEMQNTISEMLNTEQVVNKSTIADFDFTEEADAYWNLIQNEYTNRDPQVVKDSENRHEEFKEFILSELKDAGFSDADIKLDKHTETTVMNDDLHAVNIIATLEGRDTSKQLVIAGGYDGVYDPKRTEITDSDDGSSAALMLALATGLEKSGVQPQYTVKFVFGDGEAEGLRGSSWYARTMKRAEVASTVFALRMVSSADKVYGKNLGKCVVTGGVPVDDTTVKGVDALSYAQMTAVDLELKIDNQNPDPKHLNPFAEYGMEYVDFATDMNGDTVKIAAAMLMGSK